ncbi:hypothetical protein [Cesiribacter sp. SM1]|uniref:hypothetical protein n=1 Tax=Cesiribacter sp. SM1 TaxID=2861196 RepID=UPI001CD32B49|nr:hypothetical protein [Cesiribacter sp. SM1]
MQITYSPKKITYCLGAIICLLVLANIAGMIGYYYFGHNTSYYTIEYFKLSSEKNFPTYFSSAQLLFCAILLAVIANIRKKQAAGDFWHWLGLSAILLFLSADESIMIHEVIAEKVRNTLNTTGVFYFAWIIPYSFLVLAVAVAYIPFLLKLPAAVKKTIVLAGSVFVAGALGLEAVESYYFTTTGKRGLVFDTLTTIEETMEMAGILIFLHALLCYIDQSLGGISIQISSQNSQPVTAESRIKARQDRTASKNSNSSKTQLAN